MNRTALLVLCAALLFASDARAQAQHEDHAASAADQIGSASVRFDTSCAAAVRGDFNTGVAMYHSFWFPEAIKMFESIVQRDPSCGLAHWGIAMAQWGNPYAGLKGAPVIKAGSATMEKARSAGTPTPR